MGGAIPGAPKWTVVTYVKLDKASRRTTQPPHRMMRNNKFLSSYTAISNTEGNTQRHTRSGRRFSGTSQFTESAHQICGKRDRFHPNAGARNSDTSVKAKQASK